MRSCISLPASHSGNVWPFSPGLVWKVHRVAWRPRDKHTPRRKQRDTTATQHLNIHTRGKIPLLFLGAHKYTNTLTLRMPVIFLVALESSAVWPGYVIISETSCLVSELSYVSWLWMCDGERTGRGHSEVQKDILCWSQENVSSYISTCVCLLNIHLRIII